MGATIDPSRRDLFITARLGEVLANEKGQKTYNLLVPIVVGNQRMGYALISMVLDDFAQLSQLNFIKRLVATVLVFGFGIGASLILSWKYTRPIDRVVQAARRVAQGDLEETLPVERHDEIGELTVSFNDMVRKLRANKELEQRLHQAERLSSIGQLASGIAHEIRNPLNFINLSIDHLQSRFSPTDLGSREEFTHLVSRVKSEIHRLNTMITNFLTYGKPLKLQPRPCDLTSLLHDVVKMAGGRAVEQGIEIDCGALDTLLMASVDGEQIRTCLVNVLVNAFQAMPRGGKLTITARRVTEAGSRGYLEICFRDTGHGIAAEDLPRVFEPYFTTKEVGIGLGLALTKKIVEEHGGTIVLDSIRDQGTTVSIRLPAEEKS
ncbi:MAG: ATP-binding protein [Candidatus Methylomirabilis sp.]|nr:ATP-binding protein [Candidatus Methylomirabilis sp.]